MLWKNKRMLYDKWTYTGSCRCKTRCIGISILTLFYSAYFCLSTSTLCSKALLFIMNLLEINDMGSIFISQESSHMSEVTLMSMWNKQEMLLDHCFTILFQCVYQLRELVSSFIGKLNASSSEIVWPIRVYAARSNSRDHFSSRTHGISPFIAVIIKWRMHMWI